MSNAKQLAVLSTKNLNNHRWLYAKMAIAFAVLVFLVCLFSTFAISLNVKQNDLINASMSANYLVSDVPIETIDSIQSLKMTYYYFEEKVWGWSENHTNYLAALFFDLELNGQRYEFIGGEDGYNFESIDIYAGDTLWTNNDLTEYNIRFGNGSFVIGSTPQNANEVMLSEELLGWYGLSPDEVLGKSFRLLLKKWQNTVIVDYVTVCGVISEQFYQLEGRIRGIAPTIWLSEDNPVSIHDVSIDKYVYTFDRWLTDKEIDGYENDYDAYYVGYGVLEDMRVVESLQSVTLKLFLVVGSALGITLVLMIFLMMDKFIGVFSRDGGILLSCGMEWRRVKALLLCLLLWVCLFAVIIAVALTAGSYFAIRYLIDRYYGIEITVTFATVSALFAIGVATVLVIAFGYYLYSVSKMKRRSIKEFLNTSVN